VAIFAAAGRVTTTGIVMLGGVPCGGAVTGRVTIGGVEITFADINVRPSRSSTNMNGPSEKE
jgi:hypothetical protein